MVSQNPTRRDFIFVMCASISWGTVGVATQAIYAHSEAVSLSMAFFRLAIAAPLFLLASWLQLGWRIFQIKARDLGIMLLMGGLQALYQVSYSAAITYTGVTISTLIALCVAPVVVALGSPMVTGEHLTPKIFLALVSALGGTVLLVVANANPQGEHATLSGIFLSLLAAIGYAIFILCGRLLTSMYHPLHVNAVAFGSGAILLLCFALPLGSLSVAYSTWEWLVLLYLGCVPTALAYGLFQAGMRSLSATVTSIVTLCEPLTAALLAWIIFHEELGPLSWLGAAFLLGAMILLMGRSAKNSNLSNIV
jgi:DME family drug/metabolite transporter